MDAREFAKRMVTDEAFMVEITREMPDDAFAKDGSEDDMVRGMAQVAAARGWDLSEAELKKYYDEAIEGLGFGGAIKFMRRFSKVAKAAGKSKKDLKARGVRV